jgi:SMI1 / KNR4 family (SUKH-1)
MMSIQTKITEFERAFGKELPQFYIDFLTQNNLENDQLFNDLTLLYGINDLLDMQALKEAYLPNYLKIGNDSGDYGIFISLNKANDGFIYISEMGDLDEASLEKLADNFADWAKKDFDTEIFLENLYHKQDQFKRSQINAPLLDLKEKISDLNKQLNAISHQKSNGKLDLKSYLLQKKEIELNKENLAKKLAEQELALSEANIHAASRASPLIDTRKIEIAFDLKLPLLYKKLENDGMLEYANVFGSDWSTKVYPTLKNQPPFLMFAHGFELMSVREVYEEYRQMRDGLNAANREYPYDGWRDDFTMIAFAGDGSGDRFAFYNDGENEHAIIHWWHDSDHCEIKAKNLQDYMFIKMLDLALESDTEYDIATDGDIKTNLNNILATHEKYLTTSQAAVLKEIYSREFVDNDGKLSAMELDEYKQILLREIGYCEDLGEFIYTKD